MGLSALRKLSADDTKLNSAIDRKEERDAIDKKLSGSQQCVPAALQAGCILCGINRGVASRGEGEGCVPLLC